MCALLPIMPYPDPVKKKTFVSFGGYNHSELAKENELWDMENLTADRAPFISARPQRKLLAEIENPQGMYCDDCLYYVRDGWLCLWENGVESIKNPEKQMQIDGCKQMIRLGGYLLIFPDKTYYKPEQDEYGELEASVTGAVVFRDGVYAESYADANTLELPSAPAYPFRQGDAVEISGCTGELAINNQTLIIREVSGNGKTLHFYENSFFRPNVSSNGYSQTVSNIRVARLLPEMEHFCVCDNRLWGCKGNDIFASKLGDPFNFYVYDAGLSTGSYWVQTGSAGKFTGCASFLGYPVFFKEEQILKVHGNKPSNFQVIDSANLGIAEESGRSLAIAGERLFYLTREGFACYSGGASTILNAPFGSQRFRRAVGGSDGVRYIASVQDESGHSSLFIFDTQSGMWHKESASEILAFGFYAGSSIMLEQTGERGKIWQLNSSANDLPGVLETKVTSVAEFPIWYLGGSEQAGIIRLLIRVELEAGARLELLLNYDNGGFQHVYQISAGGQKRACAIPLIPRRSDYLSMRIQAEGGWTLHSLSQVFVQAEAHK